MRRIFRFDHFFLHATAIITLMGCGANKHNDKVQGFSVSAQMEPVQNLTTEERAIATRICYAYQSKNISFQTEQYYGGTFNFNITSRDCSDVVSSYPISGTLTSPERYSLIYLTTSTKPFVKNVQTNQSGFLAQLCPKIQTNQVVSNTATSNGTKIQIKFYRSNVDTYTLQYFSLRDGVMKINRAETFKVRTQFDLGSNQILGMDEDFARQQVCLTTDPSKFSEFTQSFTSFKAAP